ncbi:MAG: PaaI family thioesterase [Acidobacteriota bacterium]
MSNAPAGLKRVRAMIDGQLPLPPIAQLLGMEFEAADEGTCTVSIEARKDRHANPLGTLHGGVLCDLGDAAMGLSVATTLEKGESFTTVELRINFFKPVWDDRLTAVAAIVRQTRSLSYAECSVTDTKGSLVAKLSSTCMRLRGEAAEGR